MTTWDQFLTPVTCAGAGRVLDLLEGGCALSDCLHDCLFGNALAVTYGVASHIFVLILVLCSAGVARTPVAMAVNQHQAEMSTPITTIALRTRKWLWKSRLRDQNWAFVHVKR